jgi:formate dehydrogenase assembly factor FdhD
LIYSVRFVVMPANQLDLDYFARGLSLTEGIVETVSDV